MLWDAIRFRREASELIQSDEYAITLESYLEQKKYSHAFIEHFIIPMAKPSGRRILFSSDSFRHGIW
jgi:predicted NAD/FAD-binding protein